MLEMYDAAQLPTLGQAAVMSEVRRMAAMPTYCVPGGYALRLITVAVDNAATDAEAAELHRELRGWLPQVLTGPQRALVCDHAHANPVCRSLTF